MRSPAEPSPAAQARSRARLLVYRSRRFNALSYSRTILLTACTALERSRNSHGTYCPLELRSVCSSSSVGPVAPSKPLSALGNACLVARCPAVGETNLDRGSGDHASMDKCVHCQPRALCLDKLLHCGVDASCFTVMGPPPGVWLPVDTGASIHRLAEIGSYLSLDADADEAALRTAAARSPLALRVCITSNGCWVQLIGS